MTLDFSKGKGEEILPRPGFRPDTERQRTSWSHPPPISTETCRGSTGTEDVHENVSVDGGKDPVYERCAVLI